MSKLSNAMCEVYNRLLILLCGMLAVTLILTYATQLYSYIDDVFDVILFAIGV